MRIKLSPEADQAYQAMVKDALQANPFMDADSSAWLSAIVLAFQKLMNPKVRDELLQAVSTPESMRRALLQQIETTSLGMDAQTLRQLEAAVRKLGPLTKKPEAS